MSDVVPGARVYSGQPNYLIESGEIFESEARTASLTCENIYSERGDTIILFLDVSYVNGGPGTGITLVVNGYDEEQQSVYPLTTGGAAITTQGKYVFEYGPSVSATGNSLHDGSSVSVPKIWSVSVNHSDTTPYTYTLSYQRQ